MSVAASSSVSRQASHSLGTTSPTSSNLLGVNSSVAGATMSSLMHRTATATAAPTLGSPNSTSNSLAEDARTKRLARLRTVIEVKLLAWKRSNERLVFFQEGMYIPIKFKKRKEGEEGRNFILVVTANDKNRKVHILILMETTHANGVIDYRLVKPDRNLQRLRVINGGLVHQRISDIIGFDSDDSDSSEDEEEANDGGSTVVTRATARSRIKEADKNKKKRKLKKYIIPEDLSWVRRFPNEFTLVFAKKRETLHFAVETAQQRSDCLCHILDVFKEYYGYGFLPTLRNCTDQAVHALYLNAVTAMAAPSELGPNGSMAANFGNHVGNSQRNNVLTTSADELVTSTASADPSSGSERQMMDRGRGVVRFVDATSGDTLLFLSGIDALQRYLFEHCFIGGTHSDVKVEYLGKQRRLHRIFLERSPVLRAIFDDANSPHVIKPSAGISGSDDTTLLLDRVLAEKLDLSTRDCVDCESIDFVLRFLYTNCEVITAQSGNSGPCQESRLKVIQAIMNVLQLPIAISTPTTHSGSLNHHSDATTSSVKNSQDTDVNSNEEEAEEADDEEEEDQDQDQSVSTEDGTENDVAVLTLDGDNEEGEESKERSKRRSRKSRKTLAISSKTISKITNAIARRMTIQSSHFKMPNYHQSSGMLSPPASATTTTTTEHLAATILGENSNRLTIIIVVETMTILVLVFIFVLTQIATLFK